MSKVMFSFPDRLVTRMRSCIPARERSKVLAGLLETEIAIREERLFQLATELENNTSLKDEMAALEDQFGGDGLENV